MPNRYYRFLIKRNRQPYVFNVWFFFVVFITFSIATAEENRPLYFKAKDSKDINLVSFITYPTASEMKQLKIFKVNTPSTINFPEEVFNEYRKDPKSLFKPVDTKTFSHDLGNIAFMLVETPLCDTLKNKEESVIGIIYAYDDPLSPRTDWDGNLVWHPDSKVAYGVLSRTKSLYLTLSVYEIDPSNKIGTFPLALDPRKREEWPKPLKSISELYTETPSLCNVKRINVLPEENSLLISIEKEHENCKPIYFRFDLNTSKWSAVTLEEKEPVSAMKSNEKPEK